MSDAVNQQQAPAEGRKIPNIVTRTVTALLLLPVILAASLTGGWFFAILVALIAALGTLEFFIMEKGRASQGSALIGVPVAVIVVLAYHLDRHEYWWVALSAGLLLTFVLEIIRHPRAIRQTFWQVASTLFGILYVGFPMAFIVAIRNLGTPYDAGVIWLFIVLTSTWGADTFAYIGGRWFGKTPLAPRLSPKKTREGAVIGVIGGWVIPLIILQQSGLLSIGPAIVVMVSPLFAIVGDLFESALKRFFIVKDSHIEGLNIFPGHGGALDRIDALIWVTSLYYFYLLATGPLGQLPA